jgi:hypothetical protein
MSGPAQLSWSLWVGPERIFANVDLYRRHNHVAPMLSDLYPHIALGHGVQLGQAQHQFGVAIVSAAPGHMQRNRPSGRPSSELPLECGPFFIRP